MKGKALLISTICILFALIGSVSAVDIDNVSTDSLNLVQDAASVSVVSMEKLKVSSNNSISETNSHEDNLNNYGVQPSNYDDNTNFDSNFNVAISEGNLTNTYIITNNITLYKGNGTKLVATLYDDNNTPLSGQNITIIINGMVYNKVTNENGSVLMGIYLAPKDYNVTTIFNGSNQYAASSTNSTIKVLPSIFGHDLVMYFRNGSAYVITLLNGTGQLYVNATVTFNINGVFYNRVTDKYGNANLTLYLLPREYIITAIAPNGEMISNNITILSTINGTDITLYCANGTSYCVDLLNGTGQPYVNATVTFNINGVFYNKVTNENGTAKLGIYLAPKTYIVTAITPQQQMISNNVTVLPTLITNNITKYYLDSTTFNVILLNGTGQPLDNGTVTFNINGMLYNITSGNDGIARLPIDFTPNTYIVTTQFTSQIVSNTINVIQANLRILGSNMQGFSNMPLNYNVSLVYPNGNPVKNQEVKATVNGKSYTAKTNSNGTAVFNIEELSIGNYTISYNFEGNEGLLPCNGSSNLKIVNSTTIVNSNDLYGIYGYPNIFSVTLTDLDLKPLVDKVVIFNINGKDYNKTTNADGVASLGIYLLPRNYTISYSYSDPSKEDYAFGYNNIYIAKQPSTLTANNIEVNYGESGKFIVTAKNATGGPIKDAYVLIEVNGNKYGIVLPDNGSASVDLNLPVGIYNITTSFDETACYTCTPIVNQIVVNGVILSGKDITVSKGTTSYFDLLVFNQAGEPVVNKNIEFNILGTVYNSITDENGIAKVRLPALESDTVIYYNYTENKIFGGQNNIKVFGNIPIATIINAAVNLKSYIENNFVVPSAVIVEGNNFTIAQFLYLLSKTTVSMCDGVFTGDVPVIDVRNPEKPSSGTVVANLYDYKSLAQNIINYIEANGIAPDSMSTDVGESGFYPIVYALTRTVAFYKSNDVMPSYVSLRVVSNVIPSSPLDTHNTIADLSPYLLATRNCQVDNSYIQGLAKQLTEGLTSEWAKAQAIYNYVRDSISYSFYYNSKYGAYNTLYVTKSANCCDQANAVVALFRAAGLYARYVHGTCTFSSGSSYGHVWAQVLIGDTWVVADPTSSRNSLGVVNNWNNYQYTLHGYYRELSF